MSGFQLIVTNDLFWANPIQKWKENNIAITVFLILISIQRNSYKSIVFISIIGRLSEKSD
jgi:hypothetical protein